MGMFDWLKPHSARDAPVITNSVRDSGQIFTFGRADSGEKVDEKSAMQIATVFKRQKSMLFVPVLMSACKSNHQALS